MNTLTKLLLLTLLAFSFFGVSGCNTVKGVGRDFEALGESMQKVGD